MVGRISDSDLQTMAPDLLRALIREAVHHGAESRLSAALAGEGGAFRVPAKVKAYLRAYQERGLDPTPADVRWAVDLVAWAESLASGQRPVVEGHTPPCLAEEEVALVQSIIEGRRSIRRWTERAVPLEMLKRLVRAALAAPTGCNLQVARYLILHTEEEMRAFKSHEFSGEAARIVVLGDRRPYDLLVGLPPRNFYLDVGAAVQNLLLMAEALGLAACWATFDERDMERIRAHFSLSAYYEPVTYVALGYAAESAVPPGRIGVDEAILNH